MKRFQQTAKALGSDVLLTLVVKDDKAAKEVFRTLWAKINVFEKRFSRFLPDSELSRLNAAGGKSVDISAELRDLLRAAMYYAKQTGGLYNPFVLPALQQAGYVGSWPTPAKHHKDLDFSDRKLISIDQLELNGTSVSLPADAALDFGGIGKGYLLDQLGDYVDSQDIAGYWLSLGGDILCSGFDLEKRTWKIGVADAQNPDEIAANITNDSGSRCAIATSGITRRKGTDWHHIIDPRTGKPASTDILNATLMDESATAADVYAKCLVVLGSESAAEFIKERSLSAALLQIRHNGSMRIERYGALA